MKRLPQAFLALAAAFGLPPLSATAVVHYVDVNSTSATPPYTNWATAATNIQDAVDTALAGDEIVVTNGIYATGGRAVYGTMTNRVAVDKPLALRSVNGPQFTIIQGRRLPGTDNGDGAIRCVYLTNGASLTGFTLTNGATRAAYGPTDREWSGGGIWCESTNNCLVSNCVLVGNFAYNYGGGAYGGTLNNCTLSSNSAEGASFSTLNNCTLTGNYDGAYASTLNNCALIGNSEAAISCGLTNCTLTGNVFGVDYCTLANCIVYFNWRNYYSSSTLSYCCTTPLPTNGVGNISLDPQLASAWYLSAGSPCRGAGNAAYASGTDIDGEAWLSPPSIGCEEYYAGALTGPLSVGITASRTNVLKGFAVQLTALIEGRTTESVWDFGDGITVTNEPYASHAWTAGGDYTVVLRAYNESLPGGVSATVAVHVVDSTVLYVAAASTNPVAPYTNWTTAAHYIWDAVNAAAPGDEIVVTNGVYAGGVGIDKSLTVRSVNGPQFTTIAGGGPCVSLASNTSLSGFTVTGGSSANAGGGVYCASASAVVSNCVVVSNQVMVIDLYGGDGAYGGGAYGGTLINCTLTHNSVHSFYFPLYGGGAYGCILNNCALSFNSLGDYTNGTRNGDGGGAYNCTLSNCTLIGNWAGYDYGITGYGGTGGGASWCTLNGCELIANWATSGGGAAHCTLSNCTLSANWGELGAGASSSALNNCTLTGNSGVGARSCALSNCTLTGNSAWYQGEYWGGGGASGCTLNNCTLSANPSFGAASSALNNCKLTGNTGVGASSCALTNCTLTGNSGGGATGSTLINCTLTGNTGVGASSCALTNCTLTGNSGGGATGSTLINCTLTGNSGGGATGCTLTNCIAYFNTGSNYDPNSTLNYCCTTPLPANGGGNISADPQLANAFHLSALSPCIGKGSYAAVSGTDIDGEPWANPPSMGCDEYHAGAVTGPLSVAISAASINVAVGYPVSLTAMIEGRTDLSVWEFGDGALEINEPYATHSWTALGDYTVSLWCFSDSYPGGTNATLTIHVVTRLVLYVAAASANPVPPYSSWATAARNIQDAINAATAAGIVPVIIVSNGTYTPITASLPVSVRSINGAQFTIIDGGGWDRCASLGNNVNLSGFTLTDGYASDGGGAFGGTLNNCILSSNSADDTYGGYGDGGGAHSCTLNNCVLSGNSASDIYGFYFYGDGGGAYACTLNNCTLSGNSANRGGGADSSTLNN